MDVSYSLQNYWRISQTTSALSPRVAARYLAPLIVWAVSEREQRLLERLRERAVRRDRPAFTPANVHRLQAAQ